MTELKWDLKKSSLKRMFAAFLIACLCFTNIGFSVDAAPKTKAGAKTVTPAEGLEGDTLEDIELKLGSDETKTYKVTVTPGDASQELDVTSDNASIATVEAEGKDVTVTAVGEGKATITVQAKDTPSTTETFEVTVIKVPVGGVKLDKTSLELDMNGDKEATLTATVTPDDASVKDVEWSVTPDNGVVSVDPDGKVTALKNGSTTVVATSKDDSEKTATCEVKVITSEQQVPDKIAVTSVTLAPTLALKVGEKSTLEAKVLPVDATNKTVKWTSSNEALVSVDSTTGQVTALANTTAPVIITATADGKSADCAVTVTTDVTGVLMSDSAITVLKGNNYTLKANVLPSTASDQNITWATSDAKVATVSGGVVNAVGKGSAVITAKSANGKEAVCNVTVPEVKLNATSAKLQVGKSSTALKVESKYPSNDKVASWKSSNTKVLKVNSKSGKLTAQKKTGKATITVTMASGATATCKVTVQKGKVTTSKLSFDEKSATIAKGKSLTLKAERNPITATEKIKWSTSNKKVATVNSKGKVSAKGMGTATITAKTSNGKKATCKITVPGISLKSTKATIKVKKSTTIKVKTIVPSKDKVTYKSSNTKVATVSSKGKVTGVKAGKATITVTSKSGVKASFKVTVKK